MPATGSNICLAPTLKSHFETTINLKENNLNFGETIYLKSRADRQAANRYAQNLKFTLRVWGKSINFKTLLRFQFTDDDN